MSNANSQLASLKNIRPSTFDLDRPTRGLIKIPAAPLLSLRASMVPPPAAKGP
jgi:hypothetical protein